MKQIHFAWMQYVILATGIIRYQRQNIHVVSYIKPYNPGWIKVGVTYGHKCHISHLSILQVSIYLVHVSWLTVSGQHNLNKVEDKWQKRCDVNWHPRQFLKYGDWNGYTIVLNIEFLFKYWLSKRPSLRLLKYCYVFVEVWMIYGCYLHRENCIGIQY